MSWWPTRAHSGIATFVHIVVKSPKPILLRLGGYRGGLRRYGAENTEAHPTRAVNGLSVGVADSESEAQVTNDCDKYKAR